MSVHFPAAFGHLTLKRGNRARIIELAHCLLLTVETAITKLAPSFGHLQIGRPAWLPGSEQTGLMNRSFPSILVIAAAFAYACGPRVRSAEPERRGPVDGPPVAASLDVAIGTSIEFAFRVTNNAARKLELRFPSGQTHDFVVVDSVGREVWRWSEGRMFTQALQNRVVDSYGMMTVQASIDAGGAAAPLAPGRYVAIASLLSENKPFVERVEFHVQ